MIRNYFAISLLQLLFLALPNAMPGFFFSFFFAANARLLVTVPLRNHFLLFGLYVYVE